MTAAHQRKVFEKLEDRDDRSALGQIPDLTLDLPDWDSCDGRIQFPRSRRDYITRPHLFFFFPFERCPSLCCSPLRRSSSTPTRRRYPLRHRIPTLPPPQSFRISRQPYFSLSPPSPSLSLYSPLPTDRNMDYLYHGHGALKQGLHTLS